MGEIDKDLLDIQTLPETIEACGFFCMQFSHSLDEQRDAKWMPNMYSNMAEYEIGSFTAGFNRALQWLYETGKIVLETEILYETDAERWLSTKEGKKSIGGFEEGP